MIDFLIEIVVIAFCILLFLAITIFAIYWLRILWELFKMSLK